MPFAHSAKARPIACDLDELVERYEGEFATLKGARLFITGGTGFVGSWLLESFTWANKRLGLGARSVVLTRNPAAFVSMAPHLANDAAIEMIRGDVRTLPQIDGDFDAIVHAAAPASAQINESEPLVMIDTIVDGARNVLELATRSGKIPVLFTSSGAVYGRQPPDLPHVDESYVGAPDPLAPKNAYHEAKRLAELLGSIYAEKHGVDLKIARLFAFVGPYLPIDRHFAIGNFLRDALAQRTIDILGDGTPVRSYLYGSDMAGWLWTILARGKTARAYNVGSERTINIAETALAIAKAFDSHSDVRILGTPSRDVLPERYVPSVERARSELGLVETVALEEAIRRTIAWHTR